MSRSAECDQRSCTLASVNSVMPRSRAHAPRPIRRRRVAWRAQRGMLVQRPGKPATAASSVMTERSATRGAGSKPARSEADRPARPPRPRCARPGESPHHGRGRRPARLALLPDVRHPPAALPAPIDRGAPASMPGRSRRGGSGRNAHGAAATPPMRASARAMSVDSIEFSANSSCMIWHRCASHAPHVSLKGRGRIQGTMGTPAMKKMWSVARGAQGGNQCAQIGPRAVGGEIGRAASPTPWSPTRRRCVRAARRRPTRRWSSSTRALRACASAGRLEVRAGSRADTGTRCAPTAINRRYGRGAVVARASRVVGSSRAGGDSTCGTSGQSKGSFIESSYSAHMVAIMPDRDGTMPVRVTPCGMAEPHRRPLTHSDAAPRRNDHPLSGAGTGASARAASAVVFASAHGDPPPHAGVGAGGEVFTEDHDQCGFSFWGAMVSAAGPRRCIFAARP